MNKSFLLAAVVTLLLSACNQNQQSPTIDETAISQAVTSAEEQLFNLLREGKVTEAFSMHLNNSGYKNIRNEEVRSHNAMQTLLEENKAKGITGYNYTVNDRAFIVIDTVHVLETITAQRQVVSSDTALAENSNVTMSFLWQKDNNKWSIAYLHSSTK